MLDSLALILAQTSPSAGKAPDFVQQLISFAPLILIVLFMVFFMNKSKRKDEKARKLMIEQLKKGDRVQTIGGVLGTIVQADADEVLVKVDESSNAKIRFVRTAIHKVITDGLKIESK